MNSFTYNGTNSLAMGLRIESKNVFSVPQYDEGSTDHVPVEPPFDCLFAFSS